MPLCWSDLCHFKKKIVLSTKLSKAKFGVTS